jgi:thiamine biosynthesis lipoprotein
MILSATWPALGTTASVFVTEASAITGARELVEAELERIDHACSRFRADSELSRVNVQTGERIHVSALFAESVEVALRVAEATGGAVDPTVGRAMRNIGYDRDFGHLAADAPSPLPLPPSPGWRSVSVDRRANLVRMPPGVELDLGAAAKALAADRAARSVHRAVGGGVLVNLGGDISVAGTPPDGGWSIRVCEDHRDAASGPGQTVSIATGGLATSSTAVRRWFAGGRPVHHIVDPRTGASAPVVWRTATVVARSCVEANAASTASIVRGLGAPLWLARLALPSRLVNADGRVLRVAGWPQEEEA